MAHDHSEAAEKLLDQTISVLDKGFIRLVDYMGTDKRVVQAARVSYGEGTKTVREDRGLIHYLMRNNHTSPFEQVQLTFHAKMPIIVARQWVRHRTARLNEISGRYTVMRDEFYLPTQERLRLQSTDNKQGSSEECLPPDMAMMIIEKLETQQRDLYEVYQEMVELGLARELARINLPLSLYTEWYWQIDLHNLLHFLRLRQDKEHAQEEIRVYADVMADCARAVAPLSCEAYEEHWLYSTSFSRCEGIALAKLLRGQESGLVGRELKIFQTKLARLETLPPIEPVAELPAP